MNESKVYVLVIEHIKKLFQRGELTFGEKLPSERQLMTILGLGRNSVRKACGVWRMWGSANTGTDREIVW